MILNVNTSKVQQNDSYDIIIDDDCLNEIENYISFPLNTLIVTDQNIPLEYINKIKTKANNSYVYTIIPGEDSKSVDNYYDIINFLIDNKFTRSDLIIALGGGVVGDLTGFVASTYKRGIDFINIPTSTLSMIDSSIGGKVAVNFNGIKNIVGAFYMPKKVIISLNTLNSLPDRQYNNGLMEALKAGLIYDEKLYNIFKECYFKNLNCKEVIKEILIQSLLIKKDVVEKDPLEKNLRKILNFGHTIGHAIESQNFNKIFHGEAIAYGMLYFLSDELRNEVRIIIEKIIGKKDFRLNIDEAINLIANDKKCSENGVNCVVVNKIGCAAIEKYSLDEIKILLGVKI